MVSWTLPQRPALLGRDASSAPSCLTGLVHYLRLQGCGYKVIKGEGLWLRAELLAKPSAAAGPEQRPAQASSQNKGGGGGGGVGGGCPLQPLSP